MKIEFRSMGSYLRSRYILYVSDIYNEGITIEMLFMN